MSRPKLRKVNTQRRKQERREAERNLKRRANMLLDIDENCCVCDAAFDKKNKEMATTWHVVVYEAKGVARLTCPNCWSKVEEAVQKKKETNAS